jgi:hypothetical protein
LGRTERPPAATGGLTFPRKHSVPTGDTASAVREFGRRGNRNGWDAAIDRLLGEIEASRVRLVDELQERLRAYTCRASQPDS